MELDAYAKGSRRGVPVAGAVVSSSHHIRHICVVMLRLHCPAQKYDWGKPAATSEVRRAALPVPAVPPVRSRSFLKAVRLAARAAPSSQSSTLRDRPCSTVHCLRCAHAAHERCEPPASSSTAANVAPPRSCLCLARCTAIAVHRSHADGPPYSHGALGRWIWTLAGGKCRPLRRGGG